MQKIEDDVADENKWESIEDIAEIHHTQDLQNEQGTWAH